MTQREVDIFHNLAETIQSLIPRYFFLPGQQAESIPLVCGRERKRGEMPVIFPLENKLKHLEIKCKRKFIKNLKFGLFYLASQYYFPFFLKDALQSP